MARKRTVIRRCGILALILPFFIFTGQSSSVAQQRSDDQASPELQPLASMVGVWDSVATCRAWPDEAPYEVRSVESTVWSLRRNFLIIDQSGIVPTGWTNRLVIIAWNAARKEYELTHVMSNGDTEKSVMTIHDNVVKVLALRHIAEHLVRAELTIKSISTDKTQFRCECTEGERTWICSEGRSTKRAPVKS